MDALNDTAATAGEPLRHAGHRAAMRRFLETAWGGAEAAHSSWYPPVSTRPRDTSARVRPVGLSPAGLAATTTG